MAGLHLVTSIGTGEYVETAYRLGEREVRARFAPVALARLLGDLRGACASVLVTPKARARWYDAAASELAELGLAPEPVEIPEGRNEDELLAIFEAITRRVPAGASVVLDVTYGLRHLPFVHLAALAFLTGLRDVQVRGIYYGAFELDRQAPPILELTPLFNLLRWYHALEMARETGNLTGVARQFEEEAKRRGPSGMAERDLRAAVEPLSKLSIALATGLPLEAGLHAAALGAAIRALAGAAAGGRARASRLVLATLEEVVAPWAVANGSEPAPAGKGAMCLDRAELERELGLAEWYAGHGDHAKALGLLREWLVNAVLVARGETAGWLDYNARRKPAEEALNGLSERRKRGLASESGGRLGELWERVSQRRNRVQHAGMTVDNIRLSIAKLAEEAAACRAVLGDLARGDAPPAGTGRLLVTALGNSPGVLFSALRAVAPDAAIIVTSETAQARLAEAVAAAGAERVPRDVLVLQDPHRGWREVEARFGAQVDPLLAGAHEVVANLTGGTTAMQYGVEWTALRARRLGTPVGRLMLVDTRSPEEQRERPYEVAEAVWLEGTRPREP
ncbi:MAG: TIGR02221 family CRISPR-associated protein [Planctomycetes bacterium]|nr:TIGR02221 family CRISPR-associated protein [Planctomycetota bacterium]